MLIFLGDVQSKNPVFKSAIEFSDLRRWRLAALFDVITIYDFTYTIISNSGFKNKRETTLPFDVMVQINKTLHLFCELKLLRNARPVDATAQNRKPYPPL